MGRERKLEIEEIKEHADINPIDRIEDKSVYL